VRINEQKQPASQDFDEQERMTGEDCDDAGIADERYVSPEGLKTSNTGRESIESRRQAAGL